MDWIEVAKAIGSPLGSIIGVLGAAHFAIRRATQAIEEARALDAERHVADQTGLLDALRGELSANIYLVLDRIHQDGENSAPLRVLSG